MSALYLEAGFVLCSCALISAIVFLLQRRSKEGQIQLPTYDDELDGGTEADDPFSVTKPEDVIDGYPIQEKDFWENIRMQKLVLLGIMITLVVVQTGTLGWSLITDKGRRYVVSSALHTAFSLYTLFLSVFALEYPEKHWHGHLTIHFAALSTTAIVSLVAVTILPSQLVWEWPQQVSWYTSLSLWFLAFWFSVHMKRGPGLHFPSERLYPGKVLVRTTKFAENNVCGVVDASPWEVLLFSYTTKVVKLGYISESLEIGDLPIVSGHMRATAIFARMKAASRRYRLHDTRLGCGWQLVYRLLRVNGSIFALLVSLVVVVSVLFYAPMLFLRRLVAYLESDSERKDPAWGWVYCAGLFASNVLLAFVVEQLWSLAMTNLQVKIRVQLNTLLFAKTLVRKDIASSATAISDKSADNVFKDDEAGIKGEFSSKAQIMTLMTTDVDRVAEFVWHFYTLIDSPIEITIGALFLYKLLGVSCFIGLAVTCLFLPMNNYAGRVVIRVQDNLMKTRDERVALMNEVLGAIRMLKFMAWERSFEARILNIRKKELRYQHLNYILELLFISIWNASPLLVTLVSFWHFTLIQQQVLTPSVAFTSIAIFSKLKFALNALPETMINTLQSFVSIRRIEKYLCAAEVDFIDPLGGSQSPIALRSATVAWPQERSDRSSSAPSTSATLHRVFSLVDLTLDFPMYELSLICGKLGSGKTLLLLSLLGEADLLAGRVSCPRSPPNTIASFVGVVPPPENWIVNGTCAYVPQVAWLQNATIKENILFNLPFVEERYRKTLEACALVDDLTILEDGDESEIGERGVCTLLSTCPEVKKQESPLHVPFTPVLLFCFLMTFFQPLTLTPHTIYTTGVLEVNLCREGQLFLSHIMFNYAHLMRATWFRSTTVEYRSLEPLRSFRRLESSQGSFNPSMSGMRKEKLKKTKMQRTKLSMVTCLLQPPRPQPLWARHQAILRQIRIRTLRLPPRAEADMKMPEEKAPRKLIEEERRAIGHIGKDIWKTYFCAAGGSTYWVAFALSIILAAASPVAENGWLSYWSGLTERHDDDRGPIYYISVYALITLAGLVVSTLRWLVLYKGSIHASIVIHKKLLETVLFAQIRFHDTVSRGQLLNRFGKDIENIDSSLPNDFGNSVVYFTSACTTLVTITYVGGPWFFVVALVLGFLYYNVAKVYGRCSRDMRRLDSVSRSPLYSIYGETISGVPVLRAFGAGSKFMRDMLSCIDANTNPYFWLWKINRWVSTRINLLSAVIVGVTAIVALVNPNIDASLAGFTLVFATTLTTDLLHMLQRFVALEQSMVAVERVKEYSDLPKEGPELIEPKPPASWPSKGSVECKGLVIRYAPELPRVLHDLNFKVNPGEKVGIVGRTGSGKSTLALSFFRFVEATEGRILVDGIDISKIGLTDLRSKLTIIPQDPTILSGTLRSTLDVFDEHMDAELFEALRRVHLIPSSDEEAVTNEITSNENVFRNLDSPVSEGGDNFSTGQKQLLCMARAILKRSKVLVMDKATASVDYATDELIGKTIRHEFADSTILTIAHRLRTVIDYSRVMLLEHGRIVEYDRPATLLSDSSSHFYALCKAEGEEEFAILRENAGVV